MDHPPIKIGIIGGSGFEDPELFELCLGTITEKSVETIFGTPSDVILEGPIAGIPCALLSRHGRSHSLMPGSVNYRANIWALKEVGCTHILATTLAGSLQEDIVPGDLVLLDNFIDRTTARKQTFYDSGAQSPQGVCHIPMEPAFCPRTRDLLKNVAEKMGHRIHNSGTVVVIEGPRFSSKAESNMYRMWGGSVINMTTVPEVILAKEAGLCYAAVAMVTDYDCWRDCGKKVNVNNVLKTFKLNVRKMTRLIYKAVPVIAQANWDKTIWDLKNVVDTSVMLTHEIRDCMVFPPGYIAS